MKKITRKSLSLAICMLVSCLVTPAWAQLDDDALRLLKRELDELRMQERAGSEPTDDSRKIIQELKKRAEAQEKEIRELKQELEGLKKRRASPDKPPWGKEILSELDSLKTMVSRGVNIKAYLESFSNVDSGIQKTMGGKGAGPIFERVQEILSLYQTAGDIWQWKLRASTRPDPKDRTIFFYQGTDAEVRAWITRYPFLGESILVKAQGPPRKGPGKFRANDAIISLWDRAEKEIEALRNLLES